MPDTRAFELEQHSGSVPHCTVIATAGPMVIDHLFKFQDAWRGNNSDILIFDFSGVSYMDSSLIGSLVNAHVHRAKTGRKMALAAVPERVRQMLAVTKVEMLFQFYPSVAEAESALVAEARAQAG
jgi:anti-anti-sigma factor